LAALPFLGRPSLDANSVVYRPARKKARTVPSFKASGILCKNNGMAFPAIKHAIGGQAKR
jgi:hypothetical protein